MNSSIAATMRHLFSPQHELSCSRRVWRRLLKNLRIRGNHFSRESGAFLLGNRTGCVARIVDFVLYDDLDPHCLDTGIIHFDGRYFGVLWGLCKERGLSVVADVHTHPFGAAQSNSDRAHPMISRAGHIALILPNFAVAPCTLRDVGMYRYFGAKHWLPVSKADRCRFFHLSF